jgi:hypothetical protein
LTLCLIRGSVEAQFVVGGDDRVNPDDFEITTFASGLNYPVGMALLACLSAAESIYIDYRPLILWRPNACCF